MYHAHAERLRMGSWTYDFYGATSAFHVIAAQSALDAYCCLRAAQHLGLDSIH